MARTIQVEITGDTKGLERALGRAQKSTQTSFQKISKAAGVAGLALGGALAVAAKMGFDELQEGQKVAAQTQAVLKSTGGAANVTAKSVENLAGALSQLSGVDDEAIQASENLLLTFKNVQNAAGDGNRIFDQATKAVLDMSVAMGTDLNSATIQVGKALNDPIKGITALTRVGVTFNDKQKETIKRLVESGKTLQAQKMILRELRSEFGGSARAAGQTLPGQLAKAKNAFDELAGSLVESLLPALTTLAQVTAKASAFLAKHQTLTKGLVIGVAALSTSLLAFSVAAKAAAAAQVLLNIALIANPIGATIAAVIALGAGLVIAYKKSETFRNIVGGVADFVRKHWQLLLAIIAGPFGIALGLLIKHFDKVRAVAVGAFNLIRGAVVGVINVVRPLVEWLRDRLGNPAVRAAIVNALVSPFNAVRGVIMTVIGAVRTLINLIRSIPSPGDVIGGIAGHLPGLAAGTRNFRGGIALVGERGPELVNLPRGSDVVPLRPGAGAAMRVGAPTVMHFHFGNYVGDRRELIKTITQEVDRIARGNGGRRPF